jgi:hypothetical protein
MKLVDGDRVIELEKVQVLEANDNDTIVLTLSGDHITKDHIDQITEDLAHVFPFNKVLVLAEYMKLSTVRETAGNSDDGR